MLGGTDSAAALEHARDLVDRVGGQVVRAWENGQDVPHACDHCETVTPDYAGSAVRSGSTNARRT